MAVIKIGPGNQITYAFPPVLCFSYLRVLYVPLSAVCKSVSEAAVEDPFTGRFAPFTRSQGADRLSDPGEGS
jgi:hypothetical protein